MEPIRDQYLISVLSPTLILGQHLRSVLSPKAIPNDMVENTRYLGESDILTIISSTLGSNHLPYIMYFHTLTKYMQNVTNDCPCSLHTFLAIRISYNPDM